MNRTDFLKSLGFLAVSAVGMAACDTKTEVEPVTDEEAIFGSSLACNCVLYARSRQPKLPFGLTTYQQKKGIITTKTPKVGAVAVMPGNDSRYGHVAYVAAVNADGTITLDEANWTLCKITTSTKVKPSARSIDGYFVAK